MGRSNMMAGRPDVRPSPVHPSTRRGELWRIAVATVLVLALAVPAIAVEQSPDQQRCVNDVNRRGALALKTMGKIAYACVRDAGAGDLDDLGIPPQAQTAQACLVNDVRGTLAKRLDTLADTDADRCQAAPAQLPAFAYTGAASVGAAAPGAGVGLMQDLFGADLDAAIVLSDDDRAGADCQYEVTKRSFRLVHALWKEVLRHKRNALKGTARLTGGDPDAPVVSGGELADELVAQVLADGRGKVVTARIQLADLAALRCAGAAAPLADLFRGACAASLTPAELAACAGRRAAARFWGAVAAFDGLPIDCDLLDDGEANASCQPNVIVIMSDDHGWADIGRHASGDPLTTIPTPRLDDLFTQGIELSHFMVQPVCSPTRAELLTGRSATRVGVAPGTLNPRNGQHMNPSEVTLAEAFKGAGYATAAIGKWHLGDDTTGSPSQQGFDHFVGILRAAADYFTRQDPDDGELLWQENGTYLSVPGYTTELIAAEAVDYIASHAADPFFLYVPFTAPHNPQQAPPEYLARVPAGFDPARTTYAAMVIALDDAVGDVLDAVDANGLAGNTIVFFASDNGGGVPGNNAPLRAGKHSAYDGGVRVPAAIRIPGVAGNRIATGMIAAADVYPTLLSLAGIAPPPGPALDGVDVSAEIIAASTDIRAETAWVRDTYDAYRTQQWKLIRRADGVRELYDVMNDPGELTDLAAAQPATADALEAALDAWNADVGAFPSHIPAPAGTAAPSGDVIRAVIDMGPAAAGDLVQVRLSRSFDVQVHPGDRLEYDVRIEPGTRAGGFVLDLNRTNTDVPWGDDGTHVRDQDNLNVGAGQAFSGAIGTWKRRTVGLSTLGTQNKDQCKLMFLDLAPGRYEVYVDNIVIRRYDGSNLVIYQDGAIPDLLVVENGTTDVTTTVSVVPL